MGMTIDGQIKALEYLKKCGIFPFSDTRTGIVFNEEYIDGAIDTMRKYQMMQADYETRLKADLVAMLTEIQLEIEEMDSGCGWEGYRPTAQVIGLIQQKINELEGE